MAILLRRVCSHDTGQYIRLVYNKISEEISFKGKSLFYVIILGCSVLCHIAHFCGLVVRENIMVGKAWWNKAVHIMTSRKQDRESEWSRIIYTSQELCLRAPISFKSIPFPMPLSLPNSPSNHEPINWFIQRRGHHSYDPVTSSVFPSECWTGDWPFNTQIWVTFYIKTVTWFSSLLTPFDLLTLISIAYLYRVLSFFWIYPTDPWLFQITLDVVEIGCNPFEVVCYL